MRRNQYNAEEIIGILKQAQAGKPVGELSREHGLTDATYYRWKAKYGGLEFPAAKAANAAGYRPAKNCP